MRGLFALLFAVFALSVGACSIPSERIAVRPKEFRQIVGNSSAAPIRPGPSNL
jgi:hypothetical protein